AANSAAKLPLIRRGGSPGQFATQATQQQAQLFRRVLTAGIALRLEGTGEGTDRLGLARQARRRPLGECPHPLAPGAAQAMARQQRLVAAQQPLLRITLAAPGLEQPECQQTQQQTATTDQRHGQAAPLQGTEPALQQLHLLFGPVAQHPALPAVVDTVPAHAQLVEPGQVAIAQRRERRVLEKALVVSQGLVGPQLDTLGRHLEGRVDADPALALLPVLHPGMGIQLAYREIVAGLVELAALVAGDHPRRNPRGAQDEDHGAGVMGAESLAGTEEELVDAVAAYRRRLEGIAVRLAVEMLQQRCDQ